MTPAFPALTKPPDEVLRQLAELTKLRTPKKQHKETPRRGAASNWDRTPERKSPDEIAASFHESSHAVVALLLGYEVTGLEIRADAWADSRGATRLTSILDYDKIPSRHRVMISLAGEVGRFMARGERYKFNTTSGGLGDAQSIFEVFEKHREIEKIQPQVERMLAIAWPTVEALAAEVLRFGNLSGRHVANFVERQKPANK